MVLHPLGPSTALWRNGPRLSLVSVRGPLKQWPPTAVSPAVSLESPSRLAVHGEERVEIIDVESGEVEHAIDGKGIETVLGWDPHGVGLLLQKNDALRLWTPAGERTLHDGRIAEVFRAPGCFFAASEAGPTVCFSADFSSRYLLSSTMIFLALLQAEAEALIVSVGDDGVSRVEHLHLHHGRTRTLFERPPWLDIGRIWVTPDGNVISFVDGGVLATVGSAGEGIARCPVPTGVELHVDVAQRRAVYVGAFGRRGKTLARLRRLDGTTPQSVEATHACLSRRGRGPAVVLQQRQAFALEEQTGLRALLGPSDLLDLGSSDDGVIVVDTGGRLHSLEVD